MVLRGGVDLEIFFSGEHLVWTWGRWAGMWAIGIQKGRNSQCKWDMRRCNTVNDTVSLL